MPSDTRDWSLPTPVRALLWWPGVSFVLVIVAPDIAGGTIMAAGVLLAVIGALVATVTERLQEQDGESTSALAVTKPGTGGPPTIEIVPAGTRAA